MTKRSARGYDTTVAHKVLGLTPSTAVVELGQFCVRNNVPVAYVAQRLSVSRATVYSWFLGRSTARSRAEADAAALLAELRSQL